MIVQRTLASKSISHAKAGCILASYLKLLPMFIIIFPGMASRVLFPNRVGCADPAKCKEICGSEAGCTNIAYAELVIKLMPAGNIPSKSLINLLNRLKLNLLFVIRSNWFDAGSDVSRPHEFAHVHFQFEFHHLHHGHLDAHPQKRFRHGAAHRWQVPA